MRPHGAVRFAIAILIAPTLAISSCGATAQTVSLAPSTLQRINDIGERYQSYNVEMVEVTGGRFWRPYARDIQADRQQEAAAPEPSNGDTRGSLFQYRPPIDLTNARLRKLAAALGPAYVRISGTWANTTYFPDSDVAPAGPPAGFTGVLTRAQWKGVVDFAKAVDAEIVTSFAVAPGTRDASGAWTAQQAERLVQYTNTLGGRIAAAEFMNEPNLVALAGVPRGYGAADYGRDFKRFHAFVRRALPDTIILGPGSIGDRAGTGILDIGAASMLNTRRLLAAAQPASVDVFSYHHYGALSQRCAPEATRPDDALSDAWLARTDESLAVYRKLRDEFAPGKPLWLSETADAACGGNPWARSFLDTFRYLDQLGRLAKQGVQVVMHNTLVASDYGLLDDNTLEPKPNYWAAWLWRRLMGARVLDAGVPLREGLHVYAHCLRDKPGGVAVLAVNNSRAQSPEIDLPVAAERYTLAADKPDATRVRLNGQELTLASDDSLPNLNGIRMEAGTLVLAPATVTFFSIPDAANPECG